MVFAFLVPLLTMEINYFRLAVFRNWFARRREVRQRGGDVVRSENSEEDRSLFGSDVIVDDHATHSSDGSDDCTSNEASNHPSSTQHPPTTNQLLQEIDDDIPSIISEEAISSILLDGNILTHQLCDNHSILSSIQNNEASLTHPNSKHEAVLIISYSAIRKSSLRTMLFWIILYLVTAGGICASTRGLEEKVLAIVGGAYKFMASLVLFIVSAKIPQWVSVVVRGCEICYFKSTHRPHGY